jgi:hypothetical protein
MEHGIQRWAARGFPVTGDAAAVPAADAGSCCTPAKPAASSCCD